MDRQYRQIPDNLSEMGSWAPGQTYRIITSGGWVHVPPPDNCDPHKSLRVMGKCSWEASRAEIVIIQFYEKSGGRGPAQGYTWHQWHRWNLDSLIHNLVVYFHTHTPPVYMLPFYSGQPSFQGNVLNTWWYKGRAFHVEEVSWVLKSFNFSAGRFPGQWTTNSVLLVCTLSPFFDVINAKKKKKIVFCNFKERQNYVTQSLEGRKQRRMSLWSLQLEYDYWSL